MGMSYWRKPLPYSCATTPTATVNGSGKSSGKTMASATKGGTNSCYSSAAATSVTSSYAKKTPSPLRTSSKEAALTNLRALDGFEEQQYSEDNTSTTVDDDDVHYIDGVEYEYDIDEDGRLVTSAEFSTYSFSGSQGSLYSTAEVSFAGMTTASSVAGMSMIALNLDETRDGEAMDEDDGESFGSDLEDTYEDDDEELTVADSSIYLDYYTDDEDDVVNDGNDESREEPVTTEEDNYNDGNRDSVPVSEIDIENELTATRPSIIKSREEALLAVKEEFATSRKNLLKGISDIAIELQEAESEDEKAKLAAVIKSELNELKSLSRREAEMVKALKKKKKSKKTVMKKRPSVRSVVSLSETIIEEE